MKTIRSDSEINAFLAKLRKRAGSVDASIIKATADILEAVRRQGDRALLRYTRKFDGHERIRLGTGEIARIAKSADPAIVRALKLSASRIRRFHRHQIERTWEVRERGITLGQIIRPLERVGVYVPGGKASYPSSVLMNVIPAQVAGVKEIALCVPTPRGEVDPHVMAAIAITGIREVYTVGGAQAVGAMAYGTDTIARVDKITGPGNVFVATAKRMVFGEVDIDMIAGPSEILVIADSSARPDFVAADLLSQAEHDELASPVLVTDSEALATAVNAELRRQAALLPRQEIMRKSLRNYGAAIVVSDLAKAVDIANRIAPEHLEIMTRSPRKVLKGIKNAGAVFLGRYTAEPLGDYAAGPNHTLPTGGTARWASPLGVYDFIKRTSLLEFGAEGIRKLAGPVIAIAGAEHLPAHANSVRVRKESLSK